MKFGGLCKSAQVSKNIIHICVASKTRNIEKGKTQMKIISTVIALNVLLIPAVNSNLSAANAESISRVSQVQKNTQMKKRNSSQPNNRGNSNSFSANRDGTERVCCTDYSHEGGYSGCATFQSNQCPNYARFTPPPK